MLFQKDPSLDYGESPQAGLGNTGLSGSVHSLRKEVARFLTSDCKAPARLDPENEPLSSLLATLGEDHILEGLSAFPAQPLRAGAE